ncbi:hypothetical protein JRO89_XS05G0074200 [Xanthoceras sorbifolium]|uniref:Trichome birefringence-like C-terminal domain-containing protein n=1 Tax=Xanthoceras sorbifolium TaxID=99658 RepID=A0ABQ8I0U1_9ROSI|nr:hypothetical protein JRO89_XS05G0074200 [Xanthoceras sorbifolium]
MGKRPSSALLFREEVVALDFITILPIAIFRLYFYPLQLPQSATDQLPLNTPIILTSFSSSSPPFSSSLSQEEERADETPCDYTNGNWVHDRWDLCTTAQPVAQSRKVKIASLMVDRTLITSIGDGNQKNASSRGLIPTYFLNCLIGFYGVLRKALKTTLKTILERRGSSNNNLDVFVTTFSPAHFEGEWDKAGACPKIKPYKEGEKVLEGMDAEMRNLEVEEVDLAKENAKQLKRLRLEALDVSKLSLMRPDGHPGPYMLPNPFANGIKERVQNDCVHWCLPGPVDTWNQILLQIIKRWEGQSWRGE